VPENLHLSPADEIEQIGNEETALFAHRVAFEASLISGTSCGAALAVTVAVAVGYARHSENAGKTIFTFPADSAGRDLSARLFESIFHAQDLPS
jgi:cysteine synthase